MSRKLGPSCGALRMAETAALLAGLNAMAMPTWRRCLRVQSIHLMSGLSWRVCFSVRCYEALMRSIIAITLNEILKALLLLQEGEGRMLETADLSDIYSS